MRIDEVRRSDAADPAEAGDARHLAEDEVADHREHERDHQEVDAVAAAGERAEEQREEHRDDERHHDARAICPAEVQALRVAVGRAVADREAGDAVEGQLGERHHAAVGRQEDQARRDDAEDQHLGQQRRDPVRAEDQRARAADERAPRGRRRCSVADRRALGALTPASRRARAAAPRARRRAART